MWSSSFSLIWLKPHFTGENTEQKYHPGHNSWLKLLGHRSTEHISGSISALQTHSLGTSSAKHLSIHEAQAQAFFLHFSAHADMLLFLIRSLYYSLSLSSLEANNREWCCLRLTCIHNKKMMFKQGPMWGKCVKTQKAPIKKKIHINIFCCLQRIKKKKRQERKKQADCLNHRLPSVSEAHRHTVCTNIWSYPQTHRYSPPSSLPLLPSLLTRVVCGLCMVSTDTIACLGTHSTQCWHRHTAHRRMCTSLPEPRWE